MIRKLFVLLPLLFLFSMFVLYGCSQSTFQKNKKVNFILKDTSYEHNLDRSEYSKSDEYVGKTQIILDKPTSENYLVLVNIKKIKGGTKDEYNDYNHIILFVNGKGVVETRDCEYGLDAKPIEQPEYNFKILGYLPFIPAE